MRPLCTCGHDGDVHLGREVTAADIADAERPFSAVQTFAPFTCQMCDCSDFKAKSR